MQATATVCRRHAFDGQVTLHDTGTSATVKTTARGPAKV
jgi:hypothetical protein